MAEATIDNVTGDHLSHAIKRRQLDFVQVISARLILGVPPWQGDRRHLTHILMNWGLPQSLVAPACVALALLLFYTLAP